MIGILLPPGSLRRRLVAWIMRRFGWKPLNNYELWRHEQTNQLPLFPRRQHAARPLISIVVPAFNTPAKYLLPMIRSVAAQTYDEWELVLVDASTDPARSAHIVDAAGLDTRVRVIQTTNAGIAANTNVGIAECRGDYVAFMDHDDTIEPDALDEVVATINRRPDVGLIYSDEDKLAEDGTVTLEPHFKPSWSPHLLEHVNYVSHFCVVRADLLEKVNGLDPEMDGAQDFDLILRVTDLGVPIEHIPKVLYHWRIAESSTAADFSNKTDVLSRGERALTAHLARMGVAGAAKAIPGMPGFYGIDYETPEPVTVAILPFANRTLLRMYVKVLDKEGVLGGRRILVPDGVDVIDAVEAVDAASPDDNPIDDFLRQVAARADGPVVLINDFLVPRADTWAEDVAGPLQDPRVHTAAPAIVDSVNAIMDMGLVRQGKQVVSLFRSIMLGAPTFIGTTSWPRDVDDLTGAALAVRPDELAAYVAANPGAGPRGYAATAAPGRRNLVWSNSVVEHLRAPLLPAERRGDYSHPHLLLEAPGEVFGQVDAQQMMDAMLLRLTLIEAEETRAANAAKKDQR